LALPVVVVAPLSSKQTIFAAIWTQKSLLGKLSRRSK